MNPLQRAYRVVALVSLSLAHSCRQGLVQEDRIRAAVSIQPQAYFVEKVGGTHVAVSVLVGKGQDPYSYEPSAQQIAESASGRIYFAAGIPCEEAWIKRIAEANPEMQIVDVAKEKEIRTALVQKTIGKKDAATLALATGCKVVQVDPFAGEYVANMKRIARELRKALR